MIMDEMVTADNFNITREAQIEAYKKHQMAKTLREAWTAQAQMTQNEKQITGIF